MQTKSKVLIGSGAALALGVAFVVGSFPEGLELAARGDTHELRPGASHTRAGPSPTPIFVLAVDGLDRQLLYEMLRAGELPNLTSLLAGANGANGASFEHSCFSERALTVLPSTTIAAWTTAFTGVPPGAHGIAGNEFFIRKTRELAAPAPVSISDLSPTLALYTEDTLGRLLDVPTVYERLRQLDPAIRIWVAMSQVHRGADTLILAKRQVLVGAVDAFFKESLGEKTARGVYASLDEEVIEALGEELHEASHAPDLITLYVAGTDLYAHHAQAGPDRARRGYLREVLDPSLAPLLERLREARLLPNAWVVVLSDHGHTDVAHDDAHALSMVGPDEPPELVRRAGFRVRPFQWKVDASSDYQAVLAYNGAMAFVYVADRSTCSEAGEPCDWSRAPRYEQDVLPLAEAFAQASAEGSRVMALKGALDLVLVRKSDETGYAVYRPGGDVTSLDAHLQQHPHPHYTELESRLDALGRGPHGDRAGDVVLVANNGNVDDFDERYYFASKYRSWHGSPSKRDGEIPFILSHSNRSPEELCALVDGAMADSSGIAALTPLLLQLQQLN